MVISTQRYNRERDAMLMQRCPDALIKFMRKHRLPTPKSRAMAEVTLHKMTTAVVLLPLDVRKASKQWLTERGYPSLDDGDL
jgi:hypothetical protein